MLAHRLNHRLQPACIFLTDPPDSFRRTFSDLEHAWHGGQIVSKAPRELISVVPTQLQADRNASIGLLWW
ncbi:hypothetical protein BDV35DRAFT_345178 [Aspergillus flavus]|uniref:Uncharacterized protein n=1 Tax=Aspergillus flavus TaxID=5059 RepID=A0A5N6H4I1_ASPFL|nr:hypothetical protein BDV35DRAFT_345178 [Aspergillus flavus]